jgi:hypothetical protein
VIEGEVELRQTGKDEVILIEENDGVDITRDGGVSKFGIDQVPLQEQPDYRFSQWKEFGSRLAADPSCILYLPLVESQADARELPNLGSHRNAPSSVTLVGTKWDAGRWPGKRALSFHRECDRGRVLIPGSYNQVSWMAWVRIDDLDRTYCALLLSEFNIPGEAHWQLSGKGHFMFGVKPSVSKPPYKFHRAFGPPFVQSGQPDWLCLVTTYDASLRQAVHYVNGKEWHRESLPESVSIRFGKATIGNGPNIGPRLTDEIPDWHLRQLGGLIDEIALFSRVLDGDEIREIYEIGKPD